MKICKKIAVAAMLVSTALCADGKSLRELNIFNHLGVGVHAATTGFGVEVATPITKFVTLRAGASFMPGFSFNSDIDGHYSINDATYGSYEGDFEMEVEGSLRRTQGSVIFNVHPFADKSSFYVAAGAYFGGASVITLKGHSEELMNLPAEHPYIEVGDYKLPVDKDGNVNGSLRVANFRPYLGLGFGRAVPKRRLNFGVELGVQFMGHMKVYNNHTELKTDKVLDNNDDWQKWMDKLTVYPVLKFTLSGRIL